MTWLVLALLSIPWILAWWLERATAGMPFIGRLSLATLLIGGLWAGAFHGFSLKAILPEASFALAFGALRLRRLARDEARARRAVRPSKT